mmetsp:Transcript_102160/g.288555  ORF Transcript_102160/g.288555 Transcript_102160/m.288555 type:complete len:286 (-) Transcript_102160:418-1275(-)
MRHTRRGFDHVGPAWSNPGRLGSNLGGQLFRALIVTAFCGTALQTANARLRLFPPRLRRALPSLPVSRRLLLFGTAAIRVRRWPYSLRDRNGLLLRWDAARDVRVRGLHLWRPLLLGSAIRAADSRNCSLPSEVVLAGLRLPELCQCTRLLRRIDVGDRLLGLGQDILALLQGTQRRLNRFPNVETSLCWRRRVLRTRRGSIASCRQHLLASVLVVHPRARETSRTGPRMGPVPTQFLGQLIPSGDAAPRWGRVLRACVGYHLPHGTAQPRLRQAGLDAPFQLSI